MGCRCSQPGWPIPTTPPPNPAAPVDGTRQAAGNRELSREELTDRIQASGGIGCEHALEAITYLSGEVNLVNSMRRWAIASGLGMAELPVVMRCETEPVLEAWA